MNTLNQTDHNLPEETVFFGRKSDLEKLESIVLNENARFVSISGEGGMGKTYLALKLAHSLAKKNLFNSIIWTTPKAYELESEQKKFLWTRSSPNLIQKDVRHTRDTEDVWVTSLEDLLRKILVVSKYARAEDIADMSIYPDEVFRWMSKKKILLVLDDLDSWDWDILNFIGEIPPESVAIITSRRVVKDIYLPDIRQIDISSLSYSASLKLIDFHASHNGLRLTPELKNKIFEYSSGNPLIMRLMTALTAKELNTRGLLNIFGAAPKSIERTKEALNRIIDLLRNSYEAEEFLFHELYNYLTVDEQRVLFAITLLRLNIPKPSLEHLERIIPLPRKTLQKITRELSNSALIQIDKDNPDEFDVHEYISDFVLDPPDERGQKILRDVGERVQSF